MSVLGVGGGTYLPADGVGGVPTFQLTGGGGGAGSDLPTNGAVPTLGHDVACIGSRLLVMS